MGIGDMLQAERDAEDAARYRWLKTRMGWYSTADSPGGPALAGVASRIWYHATDRTEDTLDALIDSFRTSGSDHGA